MGSRTKFFGTVLAMLAVNSIYMQLLPTTSNRPGESAPQSSPSPQSDLPLPNWVAQLRELPQHLLNSWAAGSPPKTQASLTR